MIQDLKIAASLNWKLTDIKGHRDPPLLSADDLITCFKFNKSGNRFLTGDRGGRCVVFERADDGCLDFLLSIQSHDDFFDSLRSVTVDKRINTVEWLPPGTVHDMFLSTNDRFIKLWKIEKRRPPMYKCFNKINSDLSEENICATVKHEYSNGHSFHINSLSMNSDQRTFLSSDELRINIWDIERTDVSFVCLDIKPEDLSDVTEIIHIAKFHPMSCNLFAYGMNSGVVQLCDMRQTAHCDYRAMSFQDPPTGPAKNSYEHFKMNLAAISGIEFSSDGNLLLARDYMEVKVYDIRRNDCSLETYRISDHLDVTLAALFNASCHEETFDVNLSPDNRYIMAGTYGTFKMIDRHDKMEYTYDASHVPKSERVSRPFRPKKVCDLVSKSRRPKVSDMLLFRDIDINRKVATAWNPQHNEIVASCTKILYTYSEWKPEIDLSKQ